VAEFELIEQIRRYFPHPRHDTVLGIGDDGALLQSSGSLAVVTDTLVEGVHFFPDVDPADLGWKSLAVNLSDLAAMGAQPAWALLNLTLPTADASFVAGFAAGFAELAQQHQVELVGGDTTQGPLSITVTAIGQQAEKPLLRSGAQTGDHLVVSGTLGAAAWACQELYRKKTPHQSALNELLRPQPRLALGQALSSGLNGVKATAAMDLSDGLVADVGHLLSASSARTSTELGVDIQLASLPTLAAMHSLSEAVRWPLQLGGGDDYELLFTLPDAAINQLPALSQAIDLPLTVIGRINAQPGIRCWQPDGRLLTAAKTGYEHFKENPR
jgi:thiamine-monophosphate kinase